VSGLIIKVEVSQPHITIRMEELADWLAAGHVVFTGRSFPAPPTGLRYCLAQNLDEWVDENVNKGRAGGDV